MNSKFFDPEEDLPPDEGDLNKLNEMDLKKEKNMTLAKTLIKQGIENKVGEIY